MLNRKTAVNSLNVMHFLKLLVIILAVFFVGFLFEEPLGELPAPISSLGISAEILSDLFPIFVSFSIFATAWFAYSRSRDNHALFMGTTLLVIGLIELFHTLSYPFMPDFITPNSFQKAGVLHTEARLISGILFLASAYVYKDTLSGLINKTNLSVLAVILFLISLVPALLYPDYLPVLYRNSGLSITLISLQLVTTLFVLYASYLYAKRLKRTGQKHLLYLIDGFIVIIFSDLTYFEYDLSGHLLKLTAFLFIYLALYKSSVELPYEKLAEAEEKLLHAAEEKYRSLAQAANDAIISEDSNGNIISWNRGAQIIFGYTEEEAMGGQVTILMPERYREAHIKGLKRLRLTGESKYIGKTLEFYGLRKDGTEFPLELSVTMWKTDKGTFYTGIIHDITERKRAEEELHRAYNELEKRVKERTAELAKVNESLQAEIAERKRAEEELIRRTEDLARSNAELEQFAYIASHDLQEPLRMVSSFARLLEKRYRGRLDKSADEFIAYIVDGAARMQRMINDLLEYSRVGTRGKPFEPTDCEAVLDQAVNNLKLAVEQSGAAVTHDPLPIVMADASQMVQLFQNLISNAIKFRKREEPPRIHVSARRKGDEWFFSVKDNGIGIATEFMSHLFQLFQRGHTESEYPGTGIGLAICKKIVERHGGRIWAESEPGKGSIFYFTIPEKAQALRREAPG
ncbi:MAG: PAS domain S-box protein [Candidatus Methanoperedens sp.]|nr:PAS domain S-box protein [Candidatus Methanoperedens sp.]